MIHNDRTLLWSTSGNVYNTTFDLSEPATHFEAIEVYASGKENDANGVHLSKQTFNTQNHKMGCDCFGYSPWVTSYNYVLGSDFTISGKQCYCGSSYYMGMGNKTTAYAAGKWVNADAQKMLQPITIFGINRKPIRTVTLINSERGTTNAVPVSGYEDEEVTLSNTPAEGWYFSGYNITGATLNENKFLFEQSDVTAEAVFTDTQQIFTLTLQTDGHGTLSANKLTGYSGDTVTLSTAYNTYYRFSAYAQTGGSISNNTFTFGTQDATAKATFKPNAFTATGTFALANTVTASGGSTGSTKTTTANGILKAFTGSKPSNWPANNATWNVSNASSYHVTAGFKYTLTGAVSSYGTARIDMNGTQQANSTFTGAAKQSKAVGVTASNKTKQGTIKATFTLHGYNGGAYYTHSTATLASQGFTATGYAP